MLFISYKTTNRQISEYLNFFEEVVLFNYEKWADGTGIPCKENFQMCLSLSLNNYKIVLKSESLLLFRLN